MSPDSIVIDVEGSQGSAAVGTVSAAGEHAQGLLGKRVLIGPADPCGECDVCRRGGAAVCPSAVRRDPPGATLAAAARWAVPLEDGLELPVPAAAAIAGDIALAYTLYARTGPAPREPVVLAGASPVARFLVEILLAKSIAPIVVAGAGPWADWVAARGATVVADAAALAATLTADGIADRARRVIAVAADALGTAARLATPRSTLTVLAPVAALPGELVDREVTIIPVAGAHPDLVVEVAAMCAKGQIDLAGGTAAHETADLRAIVKGR